MKKIYYVDISNIKLEDINLSLISNDRLNKSKSYKDEIKKIQSLTAYLLLRYVFKQYNINLNDHEFSYTNNKPYILDFGYQFNITHSKNIVAVVISDSVIGVDCEYIDKNRELIAIDYLFTEKEMLEFNCLGDDSKVEYFYKKWVEKEAYFKMIGKGLTKEFNKIDSLKYNVYRIIDKLGLTYYICSTEVESTLEKINFNNINK